jgi:DNA-binding CsgD family transcriptional regulator
MNDQTALTASEVRDVVRILAETASLNTDGRARKQALADRVAALIEADRWIWLVSRYSQTGEEMMAVSLLHRGYNERDLALFMESATNPDAPVPEHPRIAALCREGNHFTRRRHELVDDDTWYASRHHQLYRKPLGLNEYLYSIRPMDNALLSGLGFHRNQGRPAFSERHSLMVHILFSAADALHLMDIPDTGVNNVLDLPPRVRTTFGLLIEGFPRKKIAQHLGVSPNTVAEYASRVYRHFGVAGQRELMLRFRNGDGHHHDHQHARRG